jgi:hypothetical protein
MTDLSPVHGIVGRGRVVFARANHLAASWPVRNDDSGYLGAVQGEAQMVGVCRPAPTNQARLFSHELDMLLVTIGRC